MSNTPKLIDYFGIFYRYARWRFPFLVLLILGASLLELVGIVTLLPLLQVSLGETLDNPISIAISDALNATGLDVSFANLMGLLIAIFLLKGLLTAVQSYWAIRTVTLVRQSVQASVIAGLEHASYPFFLDHKTGHLANLLTNETTRFSASFRTFAQVLVTLIYAIIYLPTIVTLEHEISIVIAIAGLVAIVVARPLLAKTKQLSVGVSDQTSALSSEMVQFVQSFPYLKATASIAGVRRHVVDRINQLAGLHLRMGVRTAIVAGLKEPLAVIAILSYLFYKIEVLDGSLASVVVVAVLLYRVLGQLLELPVSMQRLHQLIGGVHFVVEFDERIRAAREHDGSRQIEKIHGDIVLSGVSFRHGQVPVLNNISMTIAHHKTIGIVGESGAGKTTLFHLLTGLLTPTEGAITIDDCEYSDISRQSLRRLIGYVPQEPVLFNDSVANNLSLWRGDFNDPDCQRAIEAAAKAAHCDEFIARMPDGYETVVGERGMRLSGGQRQRLAIARELYKDPELLIFDEATSALDSAAEGIIQQSIDQLRGERTVVVIAHRLSTVRNCDDIYVFSSGQIIEHGAFDELFHLPGSLFRSMCDEQGVTP